MSELTTDLCGITLQSPFILGSGPAGFDAEDLFKNYKAGAGAVVTKSISVNGCKNRTRHMVLNRGDSLINNEGGSDMPMGWWLDSEIPKAKELGVKVLIGSVYGNGSLADTVMVAGEIERAGVDMIEIVTDYHDPADFVEKIMAVKRKVQLPVIAKVNSNWNNTEEIAEACVRSGADAVTAIDSVGPVYRIDTENECPLIGGNGYGYMTGAPIFPIAMRYVHDISGKTGKPVIGTGGITSGRDAYEMLLGGASCLGVCTYPIIHGPEAFARLCKELSEIMDTHGCRDMKMLKEKAVKIAEKSVREVTDVEFDEAKCSRCGICITACPYRARKLNGNMMTVDREKCRKCGLCAGVCPSGAVKMGYVYE